MFFKSIVIVGYESFLTLVLEKYSATKQQKLWTVKKTFVALTINISRHKLVEPEIKKRKRKFLIY